MFPLLFLAIPPPPPPNTDTSVPARHDISDNNLTSGMSAILPIFCLVWYIFITIVCQIGRWRILRIHSTKPQSTSSRRPKSPTTRLPFVSILRPIKGTDPYLYSCLASACLVDYPRDRFEVLLCIASLSDPAVPVIQAIGDTFPDINIRLFAEEEDVGPNPKIRNLNKAYREARGDIVWILDCNIWVPPTILSNSVDKLEGLEGAGSPRYKLIHHLPIVVDVNGRPPMSTSRCSTPGGSDADSSALLETTTTFGSSSPDWSNFGGRLEENFMSSSHAKMYSAINTIAVASCVVGKSTMFRRSHLADITDGAGLSFFADYICEDHMITDRIWRVPLIEERQGLRKWKKHYLGEDVVFQPVIGMSVEDYINRRTRWLRVRKYTLLAAALVEPFTESIVASLLIAYAAINVHCIQSLIGNSWLTFWSTWLASMIFWAGMDYSIYNVIHSYRSTPVDDNSPEFLLRPRNRSFGAWLVQWMGREVLAPVVWFWGMWPGYIHWRGGLYKIRWSDLKVEEIQRAGPTKTTSRPTTSSSRSALSIPKKD